MAKDPVCDMEVAEATTQHTTTHQGKTYYFCSADCKKAFDLEPDKYADKN